jgi:phasin family protein
MTQLPKEVLESQKVALESLMTFQTSVFSGFEKLVDLNLKVMKASIEESSQKAHDAVGVKDVQEVVAMSSSMVQPSAEKAMAYSRHVYDIVTSVQAELSKLAEGKLAETQKTMHETVEQLTRNAPQGSESAVAMLKSSMAQATAAYDSMTKAAKQAAEVAEKNVTAAASATFKAATDAAEAAGKTARGTRSKAA